MSCVTCTMTWIMYLPVFPDLLTTLYFMPRPTDVAMNKDDKILLVTGFAFLRQEPDDKQVESEIILLWKENKNSC